MVQYSTGQYSTVQDRTVKSPRTLEGNIFSLTALF
jgi:hypothetical protein